MARIVWNGVATTHIRVTRPGSFEFASAYHAVAVR